MSDELFKELVVELRGLRLAMERNMDKDQPLTREQAAAYLGIHEDTLYRYAKEGLLAYSQIGGRGPMRFTRADLDAFMRSNRIPATEL